MTSAREQLVDYLKQHGPVPAVSFWPQHEKLWGQTFSDWTSARSVIQLDSHTGWPTLVPQEPVRYWSDSRFAQRDAEEIAAAEQRLVFCWPFGPLHEKECEVVLRKLEARSNGRD